MTAHKPKADFKPLGSKILTRAKNHIRVAGIAVLFGLGAYGCVMLLSKILNLVE